VAEFSQRQFSPSTLNIKMQKFLIQDALTGLVNRMNFLESAEKLQFAESGINTLSAIGSTPASYSHYGFSPKGSNVSSDDIKEFFSSFGIDKPWERLKDISTIIGCSRLSLQSDFKQLSGLRNKSAHNPTTNVPSNDVQTHLENTVVIAACIDYQICQLLSAARKSNSSDLYIRNVGNGQIKVRYVDAMPDDRWGERPGPNERVVKFYRSEVEAVAGALSRARVDSVIVRDVQKLPLEFH
jgi:hypothetical protein